MPSVSASFRRAVLAASVVQLVLFFGLLAGALIRRFEIRKKGEEGFSVANETSSSPASLEAHYTEEVRRMGVKSQRKGVSSSGWLFEET